MVADELKCVRLKDPFEAFCRAAALLKDVEPYASYKFGSFAGTLGGQIERGHYLFVAQGNQLVGYVGWAMCVEAIARAWVEGRYMPNFQECQDGDFFVAMTLFATSREVVWFVAREVRKMYPNHRAFFKREYRNGRGRRSGTVFNRVGMARAGNTPFQNDSSR